MSSAPEVAMLGHKRFEPKQVYHVSLEERVPADHLLRRVAAVVDFAFARRLTARFYSHTGQPGIDPVVLFRMALIGWLYGITSERRLAEECRLNLAFMWFLGYDLDERTPDHSVLSKARARFGPTTYQAFFSEVVRQCERAGLVRGDRLYVDSTLVRANAGMGSVGARALLEQRLAGVEDHVAALWRENDEPPGAPAEAPAERGAPPPSGDEAPGGHGAPAVEAADTDRVPPAGPHPLGPIDRPNGRQGPVNALAMSRTDPDAGLVAREGVPLALYHKVHVGVDGGRARIITALDVTAGEVGDEQLLERLWKEHQGATGRQVQEVVADAKYGTAANYLRLETAGIAASIPLHEGGRAHRAVPRTAFAYDAEHDRFVCPEGQALTRQGWSSTASTNGGIIYRASPVVCRGCARKLLCCGEAEARTITRTAEEDVRARARRYLATAHARCSIRRRSCWAESAVAELKERHGLRRAACRGRTKVRIQAWGAAIAYNVKKLARFAGQRLHEPARVSLPPPYPLDTVFRLHRQPRCQWRVPSRRHHLPVRRLLGDFGNRPRGRI